MKYAFDDQMTAQEPQKLAEKPVNAPSFASNSPKSDEKKVNSVHDKKLTKA